MEGLDTGNTAWILVSCALVLLMTPALALFYGGLTRAKSVINMMMKCLVAIGIVSIVWVLVGESIAVGTGTTKFYGSFTELFGSRAALDLTGAAGLNGVPNAVWTVFGMVFAIITVALIAGAVADRMKFGAWVVFATLWVVLVYCPVAYWVWNAGGWLKLWGVLDFAGGTAVHVNAGAAALGLAIVVGRRIGWKDGNFAPHNLPLVLLGAGLLWFGWFGFNAGSAFAADGFAALAFLNTQVATSAAVLSWLIIDRLRGIKPSIIGGCSGVVAGLVAITPAAGYVTPIGAIFIGLVAGAICPFAIGLKHKFGYDDALDVVGLHLVAGYWGSISLGFFAYEDAAGVNGLFYGGGLEQLWKQFAGTGVVMVYSAVVALLIGLALKFTIGIRISAEEELAGIDASEHGEAGYDLPVNGNTGVDLPGPAGDPEKVTA